MSKRNDSDRSDPRGRVEGAADPPAQPEEGGSRWHADPWEGQKNNSDPLSEFFLSTEERDGSEDNYLGQLHAQDAAMHTSVVELLAFWVDDEEYAIDINEIQEITKLPLITEVPRAQESVLGITSLRGTIVPVLDLRVVLGLEQNPVTRQSRILVLQAHGDPVGLLVDRVTSVVRFDRDSIEARPRGMKGSSEDLIAGVGRFGDRMVIILDIIGILALMEQAAA